MYLNNQEAKTIVAQDILKLRSRRRRGFAQFAVSNNFNPASIAALMVARINQKVGR